MANIKMSEPEYWEMPAKYRPIADADPDREVTYFLLGPDQEDTPTVVVMQMKPGRIIPRHAHDSERFEVVVSGSLDVGDKVLHTGDVMTATVGEMYGPKVAGPDGCTTVEFFSNQRGATEIHYGLTDGTARHVKLVAGEPPPDPSIMAEMKWALERRSHVLDRAGNLRKSTTERSETGG